MLFNRKSESRGSPERKPSVAPEERRVLAEPSPHPSADKAPTQSFIDALIPVYLLSLEDANLPEIADGSQSALERVQHDELVGLTRSLIKELPDDEREIIEKIYFKHMSIVDVSGTLGISKSWGSRLHAKAIKHLRTLMERRGLLD